MTFATGDLKLSALSIPGVPTELMCFHAQQSVEKAIKAILILQDNALPLKTHDLLTLYDLLSMGNKKPFPLDTLTLQQITRYAVISRYPSNLGDVDDEEREWAVGSAEAVVEWATMQIESGA